MTLYGQAVLIRALAALGQTLGQVAQSVEQWTENPRVGSSILPLATIPCYNAVPGASKKYAKLLFLWNISVFRLRPLNNRGRAGQRLEM